MRFLRYKDLVIQGINHPGGAPEATTGHARQHPQHAHPQPGIPPGCKWVRLMCKELITQVVRQRRPPATVRHPFRMRAWTEDSWVDSPTPNKRCRRHHRSEPVVAKGTPPVMRDNIPNMRIPNPASLRDANG